MAKKIGSDFLKEFSKVEHPIFLGITLRSLCFYLGLAIGLTILITAVIFKVPEWLSYFLAAPILIPSVIYGMNLEERYIDRLRFWLINQKRDYQTEQLTERSEMNGSIPRKRNSRIYQEIDTF